MTREEQHEDLMDRLDTIAEHLDRIATALENPPGDQNYR